MTLETISKHFQQFPTHLNKIRKKIKLKKKNKKNPSLGRNQKKKHSNLETINKSISREKQKKIKFIKKNINL